MTDAEDRKALAEAEMVETNARKAALELLQKQREVDEWESDLARRKRDAEARQGIADAEKEIRGAEALVDPAIERRKAEAEAEKAIAEADKAVADAERSRVSALIPDFSKVTTGETKVEGEQAIGGTVLAHHALRAAVTTMVKTIAPKFPQGDDAAVLLTADPDLVTSDAVYIDVDRALTGLTATATQLLGQGDTGQAGIMTFDATAILGAVAAAVPPLVSLFSARRSLSTYAVTLDDEAALGETAGRLAAYQPHQRVHIDDFRLVPAGAIADRAIALQQQRTQLASRKVAVDAARAHYDTQVAELGTRVTTVAKVLDELAQSTPDEQRRDLENTLAGLAAERDAAAGKAAAGNALAAAIDDAVKQIDTFWATASAAPEGGIRSPLAVAALREQLRTAVDGRVFRTVLFVKPVSGTVNQMIDDRPLWWKDRYSAIGAVTLAYWLIDAQTSDVLAAGNAVGQSELTGKIGEGFELA